MAKFLQSWLRNPWPRHRLQPTADSVKAHEQLYLQIPQELVDTWVEQVNFSNPGVSNPNDVLFWLGKCDFVETVVRIRDRAQYPMKYEGAQEPPKVSAFDARKGWAA